MSLSVLDIFKIGLGPSSSPHDGADECRARVRRRPAQSRGCSGRDGEDRRPGLRLARADGPRPLHRSRDPARSRGPPARHAATRRDRADARAHPRAVGRLRLARRSRDRVRRAARPAVSPDQTLPLHPNGMRFTALDAAGDVLHRDEYLLDRRRLHRPRRRFRPRAGGRAPGRRALSVHIRARTAGACRDHGLDLHELVLENEKCVPARRPRRARRCCKHLVGHERLHRARPAGQRPVARRAQGEATRGAPAPHAGRAPDSRGRST